MADTVQESNFFPPLRTSWPHIMRSFCFYSQVHGVHSIREKRPPRVSAARRAGLFSLSLSLFFLRLPQATDPFSPNLAAACFSPSTGFRPPTIRSIVIPRVRCETGSDQIRRRSQGASEWERERERESDTKREGGRERERESFNDRGPNRPCSLCYFHRRPENVLTYTLKREKYFVRSAIATKLEGCYFWNNFESKLFTRFYYVTCCGGRGKLFYSKSFFNSLTDLHPFCSPRKIIRGISSISFICIFLLN